ncbi:hypothetical protein ABZ208_13815 [Streptomyces sp. NPDC006208]|uniref:hypothetical protein n=1 Tax=Streptomyces sp. NPDC006208 TaxID=3156734 RepID=UPI0033BDD607
MSATAIEKVNGHAMTAEPRFDPIALAEAAAIRARTEAETEARLITARAEADAARTLAAEEAEKQRLVNERGRLKFEKEQAAHERYLAEQAEKTAKSNTEREKAEKADADKAAEEAARAKEQERSESLWKWGARGIYAVGLVIAAPVQLLHFWDPARKFLLAAPLLLEGLALVLAFGAAWAVAHRRDVAPYRIGIMLSAAIAAAINLHGGMTKPEIGFNAGLIGAIASLGGPIVLMAYEHGIAQKADGIPSWRERRAADKAAADEARARARAKAEKKAAEEKAAADKAEQQRRDAGEQQLRDADRQKHHPEVWAIAESMRSARGSAVVTEQIWGEAWYRKTGSKVVGITPEIEAQSRAAQARMKVATDVPIFGELSQVDSQKGARPKKEPGAPDGRRFNGGTPPRRVPGDSRPYSPLAKTQARLEQTAHVTSEEQK